MRKFLFLPHCMRSAGDCSAVIGKQGYECVCCGRCTIADIIKKAQPCGFTTFIVPGGSLVKKIMAELAIGKQDYVIGVACDTELEEFRSGIMNKLLGKNKVAVKLARDGCINTQANLDVLYSEIEKSC